MFLLIKQAFIKLLIFGESLGTKCVSLNDEPCMVRCTLIDLNPVELACYSCMIRLDKRSGSCNLLHPKICIPEKTKGINTKVFNIITNKSEAKSVTKHI